MDEPLYIQYARFIRNALTGNFGDSIWNPGYTAGRHAANSSGSSFSNSSAVIPYTS